MDVGEDVRDVEIHCEGVRGWVEGQGGWRRRGRKGGEGFGCVDSIGEAATYLEEPRANKTTTMSMSGGTQFRFCNV